MLVAWIRIIPASSGAVVRPGHRPPHRPAAFACPHCSHCWHGHARGAARRGAVAVLCGGRPPRSACAAREAFEVRATCASDPGLARDAGNRINEEVSGDEASPATSPATGPATGPASHSFSGGGGAQGRSRAQRIQVGSRGSAGSTRRTRQSIAGARSWRWSRFRRSRRSDAPTHRGQCPLRSRHR
jgi:hypothetical protein